MTDSCLTRPLLSPIGIPSLACPPQGDVSAPSMHVAVQCPAREHTRSCISFVDSFACSEQPSVRYTKDLCSNEAWLSESERRNWTTAVKIGASVDFLENSPWPDFLICALGFKRGAWGTRFEASTVQHQAAVLSVILSLHYVLLSVFPPPAQCFTDKLLASRPLVGF